MCKIDVKYPFSGWMANLNANSYAQSIITYISHISFGIKELNEYVNNIDRHTFKYGPKYGSNSKESRGIFT